MGTPGQEVSCGDPQQDGREDIVVGGWPLGPPDGKVAVGNS